MKQSMNRVFWLVVLLFLILIGYLGKITLVDSKTTVTNSYNPRLNQSDSQIVRGRILDRDGAVLAETMDGVRVYPYARACAHLTGYLGVGKTGMEAAGHFVMETVHNEIFQRAAGLLTKEKPQGNDVVLTIDVDLQQKAYDLLGGNTGAVVMMDPSTGKILAMVSKPDFDPATVAADWDTLRLEEDGPLLNRAVQGRYPPGSTFKIVTALAAMRYLPDYETWTYECTGTMDVTNKTIHCFNETAHGTVAMDQAMAVSCNCYFAALAMEIGPQKLRMTADSLGFNQNIPFLLGNTFASFAADASSTESALVETAIGQGQTLVTPLYMAMLASAVANDGIMMKPYLQDHVQYESGTTGSQMLPESFDTVMTAKEADRLTQMMVAVVEEGTARAAGNDGYSIAAKTGTAENPEGEAHAWVIAFAPAEEPQVALAIVLEHAGNGSGAVPMAAKLIDAALSDE